MRLGQPSPESVRTDVRARQVFHPYAFREVRFVGASGFRLAGFKRLATYFTSTAETWGVSGVALVRRLRVLACLLSLCGLCATAIGQITDAYGAHAVPRPDIGHDYIHLLNETVSPANGSVNISINIPLPPGRGLTLPFSLSYNSGSVVTYHDSGQGNVGFDPDPGLFGRSHQGWEYTTPFLTFSSTRYEYDQNTYPQLVVGDNICYSTTNYMFTDPTGARHPLGLGAAESYGNSLNGLCPNYFRKTSGGDFNTVAHLSCWTGQTDICTPNQVASADGTTYTFANGGYGYSYATSAEDRNHNKINISAGGFATTYTDELGRPALSLLAYMGAGLGNENPVPTFDTITVPQYSQPYSVQWSSQRISGAYGHSRLLSPEAGDLCSAAGTPITGGWPGTAIDVISTITLPNGTFYQFTYDPTFGLIKRITYPNGGYVEYDWAMQLYFNQGAFSIKIPDYIQLGGPIYDPAFMGQPLPYYVNCMYAYDSPAVTARRVSFDGTTVAQSQTFSYSPSPLTVGGGMRTTTVNTVNAANSATTSTSITLYNYDIQQADSNDPLGFVPAYGQFVYSGPYIGPIIAQITSTYPQDTANNPLEDSIVYEDGSGNVLKTVSKTWFNAQSDIEASETVTLGAGGPSTTTSYQHAWPGQTTQTAVTNYDGTQQVTNVAYHGFCPSQGMADPGQCIATGQAIFDRPDSVTVTASTASNSPALAETDYSNYDGNGNVQTVTKQCQASGGPCAKESQTLGYDANGQVIAVTDGRGNTTRYDYTDNYTSGGTPPSQTNAYLTKITLPAVNSVTQVQKFAYDYASGRLNWAQDANQQTTTYSYSDEFGHVDPLGRLKEIDYPDAGKTMVNYSDVKYSPTVSVSKLAGGTSLSIMDGMGHVVQTQQVATGLPTVYAETVYDGTEHVASVTNPHFAGPSASDGTTSFSYDALGRKLFQCQPDNGGNPFPCQPGNSFLAWTYNGNVTTAADEARSSWTRTTDAFGRLTQVVEPGGAQTIYKYDGLGNLGTVTQSGVGGETPRIRRFAYDSLSRLLWSSNPETGVVCYGAGNGTQAGCKANGYDANGNVLYKTDARGVVTNYIYDALNRLNFKISGASTLAFGYDSRNAQGDPIGPLPNAIGRLAWFSNYGHADHAFAFDSMGRVVATSYCMPSDCLNRVGLTAQYDLAGNMTDLTYPDGRHIHQTWNGTGQLGQPGQPAVADANSGQQFVESVSYNPDSSPNTTTFGNGVQQIIAKNNRLQVQSMMASTPLMPLNEQPFLSHTYSYINPANPQSGNNGNIWGVTDALNGSRSQSFTYDALNRISGFSLGGVLNQRFQIDSFGNLGQSLGVNWLSCFDPANNRLNDGCSRTSVGPSPGPAPPALSYDAAGNLTGDTDANGLPRTYTYDAESRLSTVAVSGNTPFATYAYEADGNRVQKFNPGDGTFTEYVNFNGQPIAERDQTGLWTDYIYANGQKVARLAANTNVLHHFGICGTNDWCPYGNATVSALATNIANYVLRQGDKLIFIEKQTNAASGLYMYATDGSNSMGSLFDDAGDPVNASSVADGQWHTRTVDLSGWAGKTISPNLGMSVETNTPRNVNWDAQIADVSLVSADGTALSLYNGQNYSGQIWGGGENAGMNVVAPGDAYPDTHFYLGDHLGTAQLDLSAGGWPVWQGQFAPFGGELVNGAPLAPNMPDGSSSHYKFTGKERDTESGLDYFGARYYASSMGRFMSPDAFGGHYSDPQTLNLYAYVRNNPLRYTDPTGHDLQEVCTQTKDNKSTCGGSGHEHHVGTTDDKGHFNVTHFQTDSSGNLAGHSVSFNTEGIQIDGNKGEFIAGTDPTRVNGEAGSAWASTHFVANSNCGGTCEAGGAIFGSAKDLSNLVHSQLIGPNKGLDGAGDHEGEQWRGGNRSGPDMHLSFILGQDVDPMHFDNRYPYGSTSGFLDHAAGWMNPEGHIHVPLPQDIRPVPQP